MSALRVSELIRAAQSHLEEHGDTAVSIVINRHHDEVSSLYTKTAHRTGRGQYNRHGWEQGGECHFEVETDVVDRRRAE